MKSRFVLDVRLDGCTAGEAADLITSWAEAKESRYVCAANVHMVMETKSHPDFFQVVKGADLVVPDGMPLVWLLKKTGIRDQVRVTGWD